MIFAENVLDSDAQRNALDKAYRILFNWRDCIAESEKEFNERVRKFKIISVMKSIIENELTPQQKKVLSMKYFDEMSYEEISRTTGLSPSAALRSAKKAESIVGAHLKYVVQTADMGVSGKLMPLDVRMAIAELMSEHAEPRSVASRLRKARKDSCISEEKASLSGGITPQRLSYLERTGSLTVPELKKLASIYCVSADYILFGA